MTLSRYDGETVSSSHIYESVRPEKTALETAFGPIQGPAVTNWIAPENPWPVYTLLAEADLASSWKQLAKEANIREDASPLPCLRLLALGDGGWDARFMAASGPEPPLENVPMALTASGNALSWKIINQSGQSLSHGNGGFAGLQVLLDGPRWAVTAEGHFLPSGKDFSSGFSWAPYPGLPNGTYRLTFPLDVSTRVPEPSHDYAATSFQLKDGAPILSGSTGSKSK